jgi:hypothetical protein
MHMKKRWRDPVKGVPPQPETLAIKGDWEKFTNDMKRVLREDKGKPISASPGPGASS